MHRSLPTTLPCLLLAAMGAPLAGCYSYTSVPAGAPPVGHTVRARISAAEAERIGQVLGREERTLEGQLLEASPEGDIVIAVPSTVINESSSTNRGYQRIVVPRADLQFLEQRQLDRVRTGAIAAVGVVAVTAAVFGAFANASPGEGTGRPGTERQRVPAAVPLLRLTWGARP